MIEEIINTVVIDVMKNKIAAIHQFPERVFADFNAPPTKDGRTHRSNPAIKNKDNKSYTENDSLQILIFVENTFWIISPK